MGGVGRGGVVAIFVFGPFAGICLFVLFGHFQN